MRFGLSVRGAGGVRAAARRAEAAGYATILFPDHPGVIDPFVAATGAAAVTERLRVGPLVANNELRPVAALAQLAATLDEVSGGRLELGLGAGNPAGGHLPFTLPLRPAGQRVRRLERSILALRRLLAGEAVDLEGPSGPLDRFRLARPPPQGTRVPLLVGGNGDRLLAVAARHADTVNLTGFSTPGGAAGPALTHLTAGGLADRVRVVRAAAGARRPELSLLVQRVIVTDHPRSAAAGSDLVRSGLMTAEELLASPFVLIGSVSGIEERLRALEEQHGIGYVTVLGERCDPAFDAVVARLAG